MDKNKLRIWIQKYVIAWSNHGIDMQKIMLEELDKVFEEKEKTEKI